MWTSQHAPYSVALTRSIRVTVQSTYRVEQSMPAKHRYVFSYSVVIANEGAEPVQLLNRYWNINDGARTEEVSGAGVVGCQPLLKPGQSFEYTSGCVLKSPRGKMRGSYEMVTDARERFDVEIAEFALCMPIDLNLVAPVLVGKTTRWRAASRLGRSPKN